MLFSNELSEKPFQRMIYFVPTFMKIVFLSLWGEPIEEEQSYHVLDYCFVCCLIMQVENHQLSVPMVSGSWRHLRPISWRDGGTCWLDWALQPQNGTYWSSRKITSELVPWESLFDGTWNILIEHQNNGRCCSLPVQMRKVKRNWNLKGREWLCGCRQWVSLHGSWESEETTSPSILDLQPQFNMLPGFLESLSLIMEHD